MRGQAAGIHVDVRRPMLVRAELRLVAHALALSVEARDAAARRPLAEEREPHLLTATGVRRVLQRGKQGQGESPASTSSPTACSTGSSIRSHLMEERAHSPLGKRSSAGSPIAPARIGAL